MTDPCIDFLKSRGLENQAGKVSSAEEALSCVRPGDHIFVGTACATPRTLVKALEGLKKDLSNVQLFHFLTTGAIENEDGVPGTRFRHKSFFVGTDTRDAMKTGRADYIPISISQVPILIETGRIGFDVALVQVSMPDTHGYVSLGTSVDITYSAIRHAKSVIAEVNPNMPRTLGESFISLDEIDHIVMVDEPVIEYSHRPIDAVAEQIARYVARIVEDGSTLQIGLGRIPNEMLKFLDNKKDIGIHSDVITDPVVDLVERGVINGRRKTLHPGKVVTSYCLGTRRLFDAIDRNPMFSFYPIDYICDEAIIAKNHKMVSVTQAFAVDLTGQVCSDQFQSEFYSGVSTQPDFVRSAAKCPAGKSIICVQSTTEDGTTSRIRPLLLEGEGVTIARADVHYLVTEYGIVYLFGKSIRERALLMIEIAHPRFRPWLLDEAKRLGYVHPQQELRSRIAYPVEEERTAILKDGTAILIRPAKASDVEGLQDIFYHMSEIDIYTRFFYHYKSFPLDRAQHLCSVDYDNEMAFVATIGDHDNEKIIGSSCYFLNKTNNIAETAFMIRPEWQGNAVGTRLQERMMEYAKSRGIRGFVAEILKENSKMIKLAMKSENVRIERLDDMYEVTVLFSD